MCGPQSRRPDTEKVRFYDEVTSEWDYESSSEIIISLGDFNGHMGRDGQLRIIYYSRIVTPNPNPFFAISTIYMKPFITSLQQQKNNQRTSLLQCNTFRLSTCLRVCAS